MGSKQKEKPDVFGFSRYDKRVLLAAWELVNRDLERNAVAVFIVFFMDYPEHKKYFNFKQYDPLHLSEDPQLKFHATRVFRQLAFCVEHINDPDAIISAIRNLSSNHKPRKITQNAYDDLRRSFLKMMLNRYEDRFTMDMAECMNKILETIFQGIINDDFCGCTDSPGPSKA